MLKLLTFNTPKMVEFLFNVVDPVAFEDEIKFVSFFKLVNPETTLKDEYMLY